MGWAPTSQKAAKQNRMQKHIDVRNQLDLQIDLLTEKEATKTLQLLRAIAEKLDVVPSPEQDKELNEMARQPR